MRISDWSSDVCSSDLPDQQQQDEHQQPHSGIEDRARPVAEREAQREVERQPDENRGDAGIRRPALAATDALAGDEPENPAAASDGRARARAPEWGAPDARKPANQTDESERSPCR